MPMPDGRMTGGRGLSSFGLLAPRIPKTIMCAMVAIIQVFRWPHEVVLALLFFFRIYLITAE